MVKIDRALRLAILAMRAEIQRIAFNANLEDRFKAGLPVSIAASRKKKNLLDAIEALRKINDR